MLSKSIQDALNEQIKIEAESSQVYLAMASWAEIQPGINNITSFFYRHSDAKRMHMHKIIHFVNDRGGFAMVPALGQPQLTFPSCLLYTSPSPRDATLSRMPSSA